MGMLSVGIIGWRGMVGSVLVQRMREERDFDHVEPVSFSTSQAGGKGPAIGRETAPVGDAMSVAALKALPVIISCQGGDYTGEVYPKLRAAGWKGYWIDAASALRMNDDAVIILDPVNMPLIKDALRNDIRNYIGGNCTVSLMLMGMAGLLQRDEIEWMTSMTYQAASGQGAAAMRDLVAQMATIGQSARSLLDGPASAILDIDRVVSESIRSLEASCRGSTRISATDRAGKNGRRKRRATRSSGATTAPRSPWTASACAAAPCAATARR